MSGKVYRVVSRSSLDQDKRGRYKLWLRLSLIVNAAVLLIWLLGRKANIEPIADM